MKSKSIQKVYYFSCNLKELWCKSTNILKIHGNFEFTSPVDLVQREQSKKSDWKKGWDGKKKKCKYFEKLLRIFTKK